MPDPDGPAAREPLIVRIVIDADEVEVIGPAAEPGPAPARKHVPGFELGLAMGLGGEQALRPTGAGHDVDHRIDMDDPGARVDRPDRLDSGDRGAHQLMLQLGAAAAGVRVEARDRAAGPCPVRDLVDRAPERRAVGLLPDQSRYRRGEAGEPVDEAAAARCPDDRASRSGTDPRSPAPRPPRRRAASAGSSTSRSGRARSRSDASGRRPGRCGSRARAWRGSRGPRRGRARSRRSDRAGARRAGGAWSTRSRPGSSSRTALRPELPCSRGGGKAIRAAYSPPARSATLGSARGRARARPRPSTIRA